MGQSCSHHGASHSFFVERRGGPEPQEKSDTDGPGLGLSAGPGQARWPEDEHQVPLHLNAFLISIEAARPLYAGEQPCDSSSCQTHSARMAGWRSHYALGPMLGDGVSAKVYEGEALATLPKETADNWSWGDCAIARNPCSVERGRKVAIKRFHRAGSRTFKKELNALQRVGIHPHVLRLLESYEGCGGEDVLILEYCDGSTVYDLYAREHPQGGLPERMIARMIRQLLLALEHLGTCGVEHQDVKPENMMLYDVSVSNSQADLKLGDFGWATIVPPPGTPGVQGCKPPASGAGSLWYAPPELNPPVSGVMDLTGAHDPYAEPVRGRADMWSAGVVTYLLLVGHNPFNAALKLPNPQQVESEVMRLAALGNYNRKSEKWLRLHSEARDFIGVLLRVKASARPSATDALQHPFVARRVAKSMETSVFFHGPVSNFHEREAAWYKLDGMQHLGWLAVARAVAEPELDRQVIATALEGVRTSGNGHDQAGRSGQHGYGNGHHAQNGHAHGPREAYLWELARELGTAPVSQWLQDRPAWAEVLRLAFCYMDVDGDGLLGPQDLAEHARPWQLARGQHMSAHQAAAEGNAWNLASRWVARWHDPDAQPVFTSKGQQALSFSSFRSALLASDCNNMMYEALNTPMPGDVHPSFNSVMGDQLENVEEEIAWPAGNSSHRPPLIRELCI